jgi:hypothetical protein
MLYIDEEKLLPHVGHLDVFVSAYGPLDEIENLSVECEQCNEVLIDADYREQAELFALLRPHFGHVLEVEPNGLYCDQDDTPGINGPLLGVKKI